MAPQREVDDAIVRGNFSDGVRDCTSGIHSNDDKLFRLACMLVIHALRAGWTLTPAGLHHVVDEDARARLKPFLPLLSPELLVRAEKPMRREELRDVRREREHLTRWLARRDGRQVRAAISRELVARRFRTLGRVPTRPREQRPRGRRAFRASRARARSSGSPPRSSDDDPEPSLARGVV